MKKLIYIGIVALMVLVGVGVFDSTVHAQGCSLDDNTSINLLNQDTYQDDFTVELEAEFNPPSGSTNISYQWNVNDSESEGSVISGGYQQKTITYDYSKEDACSPTGECNITLIATDESTGECGSARLAVDLMDDSSNGSCTEANSPLASFDSENVGGNTVKFTSTAIDPNDDPIDTYYWDFINGASQEEKSKCTESGDYGYINGFCFGGLKTIEYTFSEDEDYNIIHWAIDSNGCESAKSNQVVDVSSSQQDSDSDDVSGDDSSFQGGGSAEGGLVPCSGVAVGGGTKCTFEDLITLVSNAIDFMITIGTVLAMLVFAYAGFLYLTAGGNPGKVRKARGIFTKVIYGFAIMLLAWLIVNTILTALGVPDAYNLLE